MRDQIKSGVRKNESFILNLDESKNEGTHWTCLFSKNGKCFYFDSFGFEPPLEIQKYCYGHENFYSSFRIQKPDQVICGHYCIYVIYKMSDVNRRAAAAKFNDILNELYNI